MPATQKSRLISVHTPLGEDVLLFHWLQGTEQLGRPFEYHAEFLCQDNAIDFDHILGQNITFSISLANRQTRYINGYVTHFGQHGTVGEYHCYRAAVRPWIWFLTRTTNCRIFQDLSVPDIVKQVCHDHGFTDIEAPLTEHYPPRPYIVQYRETDLAFISRLLEREGIYYYFHHDATQHTLVLADALSAHQPVPGYQTLPYYPWADNLEHRERDHIFELTLLRQVQPGRYTLNDYDLEKPRANLFVKSIVTRHHAHAEYEHYDYPGDYVTTDQGEAYANTRSHELHSAFEPIQGTGNVRRLTSGSLFTLTHHPRADQNREYLITRTTYSLQAYDYRSAASASGEDDCRCQFSLVDSKQPYKPARTTARPIVQGPQTAVVVGPQGEEIYTDRYGRVKVQFHWDRQGQKDENSSCWIRVSQPLAGKSWGAMALPRIGQEVIVDFLEGDPDRPIITGRVYNDECRPPYDLPANKTVSTFKTNSSKGGLGFNELRFEDNKGQEQIFLHAEKNQDIRVKHDSLEWIGNQRHLIVTNDQREQVNGDKHLTVHGDHNEKVMGSLSHFIGSNLQDKVGAKYAMDAGQEIHLAAGVNVVIDAGASITLKTQGAFIVIGPSGINLSHRPDIGGSPGSGSGCTPGTAQSPLEADIGTAGKVARVEAAPTVQRAPAPPPTLKPWKAPTRPTAPYRIFDPKNGIRLGRFLGPIAAVIAGLIPDNASLEREWDVEGVHYKYNPDDFNLEITDPDGTTEQLRMEPDGTVTDSNITTILGSTDKNGVFTPVTEQEELEYRTWRANGGEGSFGVWRNSGKPLDSGGASGNVGASRTVPTGLR